MPVLTELRLLHELVVPPNAPTVFLQLVRPRRRDDFHLVLEPGGLVHSQEKRVDGDPSLLPRRLGVRHGARVDLHAEVALYPRRGLVQLAHGPFEVELALSYPVRVVLRHAEAHESHGIDEVTLDPGRLALPSPRSLDGDQLRYRTVLVRVTHVRL